jgi:hypothetical protein
MKSTIWLILFSLLAQAAFSQQKGGSGRAYYNDFEQIQNNSNNVKSTQNKGMEDYKLELFPGQVFTGWYYFWSNGGIKNCNLKENPVTGWLSITPNKFTSTGCTNIIPVKVSFIAPMGEGVYISNLVDSTANWDTVRVEVKVTTSPVNHIKKKFGINQDSISFKSFLRNDALNWSGNSCIKDYWPADSIKYDFYKNPVVSWLKISPSSGKAFSNEKQILQNTLRKKLYDSTWVILERNYYSYPTFYHYYLKETEPKEYMLQLNGKNLVYTGYYPGSSTKTLMYWVQFDTINNQAIGVHDGENHRFYLGVLNNNTLFAGMGNSYNPLTGLNLIPGKWYHMALTTSIDLDSAYVYVNGIEVSRFAYSFSGESKANFYIGARNDFTTYGYFIKGLIDEVQVWERPLSRNEIVQYMFEPPKGNESGLAIYYPFNEGWGDFTKNSVDNYYYGTLFKEPAWIDSFKRPVEYPVISLQPSDQNITYGNAASFNVAATGTGTLTYQWQQDAGSGFTDINNGGIYSGVTSATLNISLPAYSMNGYKYQVIIINPGGSLSVTSNSATLKVAKRAITITAYSKTKVYGLNDPALTYQITSGALVGSDILIGSLTRDGGESVAGSPYAINMGSVANSNYTITYMRSYLVITPLVVTVHAQPATKVYGQIDPTLTYVSIPAKGSSLTNGEVILFTGSLTRLPGETVAGSPYAIGRGGLNNSNYIISFIGANMTITLLAVTVTADAKFKIPGAVDPELNFVSNPVVGMELPNHNLISFTGALSRASGEAVGIYPIGQNTVANSNYAITYIGANLTISLATTVEPILQGKPRLKVYPNPFNNHLYFELKCNKGVKASIEIFNINGIKLATIFSGDIEAFHDYRLEYTPEKISSGLLIYRLIIDGQITFTGKLVHK